MRKKIILKKNQRGAKHFVSSFLELFFEGFQHSSVRYVLEHIDRQQTLYQLLWL